MPNSENGQSAFHLADIIGTERLFRGACVSERGRHFSRLTAPFLSGKEAAILTALYEDEVAINPYLYDSTQYHAWRSGAGIERADLQDVVRILG